MLKAHSRLYRRLPVRDMLDTAELEHSLGLGGQRECRMKLVTKASVSVDVGFLLRQEAGRTDVAV